MPDDPAVQLDIFTDELQPQPEETFADWLAARAPGDYQLRPGEPWPEWLLR